MTRWDQWVAQAHQHLELAIDVTFPPGAVDRLNISPGQQAPIYTRAQDGRLESLEWGLSTSWSRNVINARSETAARKATFRNAWRSGRCLVPADGFYEWKATPGGKQPYRIDYDDQRLFAFAGLREADRFVILTTTPNALVSEIHNRMPVILHADDWAAWLDLDATKQTLDALCAPAADRDMRAQAVSRDLQSLASTEPATDGTKPVKRKRGDMEQGNLFEP